MDIEVFQAGFDAHRAKLPRSSCSHPAGSAEHTLWTDGWDTRDSYISTDPLVSQIYLDAIGDILRAAYGSTTSEPLTVEMVMLLLDLGVASEVRKITEANNPPY